MNMNNNPTLEELRELTAKCDDNAAPHALWISVNGDVYIDPIPNNPTPVRFEDIAKDVKIRYEKSVTGAGYVGEKAASDDKYMERIYKSLVKEWADAKDIPGEHYIESF